MRDTAETEQTHSPLEQVLKEGDASLTRSGRIIASYLRDNLQNIPYETGATIAAQAGVSEMSVIRFIRGLGYASLKDLKDTLKPAESGSGRVLDDTLERFRVQRGDVGELEASLELELRAITDAYLLTTLERWHAAAELLTRCKTVHVVGFQASKGLALDFASRLKYARGGVRFAEGGTGVYSEIIESDPQESCLVLVDTAAYARKGVLLAERVRDMKMPLIIVTDRFSNWAYEFTELVLQGSTHVKAFWDSTASVSVILNLLINSVAGRLGDQALKRYEMMRELGHTFKEFEMPPSASVVRDS